MPLTVGDVIGLPVLQRGEPQVLTHCRWAEPIRWIHVGEVADLSSLLQGGELVLTTGVGLRRAPRRYLQGLADAGALGVVVELGKTLASVPNSVTALAERLDLALVALHRQVKFVDVTEVVHRRLVAAQYDEVAFDRRIHETFTELSMKRATAAAVVDAAARMLDRPVVLEDLAHQVLAVSITGGGAAATVLPDWERRSRMNSPSGGGDEQWTVAPVGLRGEEWGRLIVPTRAADPARALMVLERAAAALALNRLIEWNQSGLHQQAQSGLIEDVLQSRITDEWEIAARAHALGLRKAARYFPVVVRVEHSRRKTDPVATQRNNVRLLDVVAHTVNSAGHSGLFSVRRAGEIAVLLALNTTRGGVDKALTVLGDGLRSDLARVDGVAHSVCAVGTPEDEIADAIRGLRGAGHVAEVAIAMPVTAQPFFRAADVRLRGLIALLREDPRVQQFAETELRPLLVDDSGGELSNMEVLRQYLALSGNKSALAQRLHVSRPALYKRLTSIGRLLGTDLDDAESMTSLSVAMMVLDAQARAEPTMRFSGASGGQDVAAD
jgi:purine catabolism regulator